MKWGWLVCLLWVSTAFGGYASAPEFARDAVAATWSRLHACGLKRMDAYAPQLPRPPVPAHEAVVNSRGQVLAYTLEWFAGLGMTYEFKSPNGGLPHFVWFNSEGIAFQTPYNGIVAQATRQLTPYGAGFNFVCGQNTAYSVQQFERCVTARWANVISTQLCRYGTLN